MHKDPLPPSLTGEELKRIEVWERTHQSRVVRRLLAEIARLQQIALRANQMEKSLSADRASLAFNSLHVVASSLRKELDELPLIAEREEETDRLLYGHMAKRKVAKR